MCKIMSTLQKSAAYLATCSSKLRILKPADASKRKTAFLNVREERKSKEVDWTGKRKRRGEEKGTGPQGKGKKRRKVDERVINPFHLDVNGNQATSFISFIKLGNIKTEISPPPAFSPFSTRNKMK